MQGKRKDESENYFVSNRRTGVIIQPQRIAFLPGGKLTRVQVWFLIKLESSSRIESIQASYLLASANHRGSISLSRVFVTVAASPSSWSWSILAEVRSAVGLLSLGPWGESREPSSLAGVGSKELEFVGSSSRQRPWIWFCSVEKNLPSKTFTALTT